MQVFMSLLFLLKKKKANALTSLSQVHYFKCKRMNITNLGEGLVIVLYFITQSVAILSAIF